jgi:hypothetical protein
MLCIQQFKCVPVLMLRQVLFEGYEGSFSLVAARWDRNPIPQIKIDAALVPGGFCGFLRQWDLATWVGPQVLLGDK